MATDAITDGLEDISLKVEEQVEVQEANSADMALASLDSNQGWLQLREHLESRIVYHKEMQGVDTKEMSLEAIGQRFVVSSLIAAELEAILSKVDNTVKEVRRRAEEKGKPRK